MIYDIAILNLTPTISLNELVRVISGLVGFALHVWLISQAVRRKSIIRNAKLNGGLAFVAQSRIENEYFSLVLQLLMFLPAVSLLNVRPTAQALSSHGVTIIWMQAAVSVILTVWAWRRRHRAVELDELLDKGH